MPEAPVATEVHESLDIHRYFATQITFNLVLAVNNLADIADLIFRQMIRLQI